MVVRGVGEGISVKIYKICPKDLIRAAYNKLNRYTI